MNTSNTTPLALVTGAGQGIGEATARRLVQDGYRVAAVDRDSGALDRLCSGKTDGSIFPVILDLAQRDHIKLAMQDLLRDQGPVTVLVNNAGVWPGGLLTELPDETWDLALDVNLTAPFVLMRALAPAMAEAGGGAIVNVASRNAFRSSVKLSAYDASKAGLVALTRTAAGELAGMNIRVNAVCPGVISTPGDTSIEEPKFKAAYSQLIPMDRYGRPDEIAGVISFLASKDASFMTGQALIVDGGQIACQDNGRFMEIPGL
jgi:NAD(P)-dependent dehydrogenase (short-subunit alcohol dehydrogenase family)